MSVPILQGYSARLKAARQHVEDTKAAWKLAIRQRNELVIEAVDNGHAGTNAARDAGLSQPHVVRIMSGSYDDVRDLVA